MIRIALAYALFLISAVVAADAGYLPRFAEWLHDLPFGDKVSHFLLFGLLAMVANLALAASGRRSLARAIVIGSAFALLVATVEETSNLFLVRRDWSLGDLAANYLGVACLGLVPLWHRQWLAEERPRTGDDSPGPQDSNAMLS